MLFRSGSETVIPPIKGVDTTQYWTSTEALDTKQVPASIVIIGGGVIGMEFAGIFSTLGATVSIVEMASEILPGIDQEIASMLRNEFSKKGVKFYLGCRVMELSNGKVTYQDAEGDHII